MNNETCVSWLLVMLMVFNYTIYAIAIDHSYQWLSIRAAKIQKWWYETTSEFQRSGVRSTGEKNCHGFPVKSVSVALAFQTICCKLLAIIELLMLIIRSIDKQILILLCWWLLIIGNGSKFTKFSCHGCFKSLSYSCLLVETNQPLILSWYLMCYRK